MFDTLLIANRGEIARRIIRTARRMGLRTVAVYSDVDANSPHVTEADIALCIGGAAPADSYLRADRILAAAKTSGAGAVHPGYGFLSENTHFAEACAQAGIIFVGPPASSIRAMGDKAASKRLMRAAGVPLAEGYDDEDQTDATLRDAAARIGWPVMIKASAGGGGKGMRIVERAADFDSALAGCRREAKGAFGDDRVLIEKYITRPRHVEVQIFADTHGNTIHLYDRDCSAQRRHQKVIEEAPAPNLPADMADAMRAAAVRAAKAVGYVGAGTVEFLVGQDAQGRATGFYFMEMNTRLQVEHPVTEMVTGLDLVEWQLRVAAGEPLPSLDIPLRGHAVEARLYAEDAEGGFLPQTGSLNHVAWPTGVRVDAGVEQGGVVTPHYDPMIAKIIAHAPDRRAALRKLATALADTVVMGVTTNAPFLRRLAVEMQAGVPDTGLIARSAWLTTPEPLTPLALLAAALDALVPPLTPAADPFALADGWRIAGRASRTIEFVEGTVHATPVADGWMIDGAPIAATRTADGLRFTRADQTHHARIHADGLARVVVLDGVQHRLTMIDRLSLTTSTADAGSGLRAPMPGKVTKVFVTPGQKVTRGDALFILEAMKMEHTILAPADGVITPLVREGEQVKEGEALGEMA